MTSRVQAEAFLSGVIRPACDAIGLWSDAAGQLLLGTALQESGLVHRRQIDGGPALGLMQIEPATYEDTYQNYLRYPGHAPLLASILQLAKRTEWPEQEWLVAHDQFSVAIARVKYLRVPAPLPAVNDIPGMAAYWLRWYNAGGAGSVQAYLDNWHATFGDSK